MHGTDFFLASALTPKYLAVDVNSSGDNTLVAAVSGKRILVIGCVLIAAGTVSIRFESGAGGTPISGVMDLTTNSGFTAPLGIPGWGRTATNTLLNLELSGAVKVSGMLVYVEIE